MNKIYFAVQRWRKWLVVAGIALTGALSWMAMGQSTPPDIKAVALSSEPLYSATGGDKPTITINMATDYTVLFRQYKDRYTNAKEYLGYWDADSCYRYENGDGTDNNPKRFVRSGPANTGAKAQRTCDDAFSGNFLNFSTMSSLDALRLALTGGDRLVDTGSLTVLQRAVLPDGQPEDMGGDGKFDPFILPALGGASGIPYFGAIPQIMIQSEHLQDTTVENDNDLVVYNRRNQLQFVAYHEWSNSAASYTSDSILKTHKIVSSVAASDEYLYARVEVCNKTDNGALADTRPWALCTKQPNGNYKPTGSLQKYSNKMRVAVMSFLTAPTGTRYGGVLRSPMKYIGQKTFDSIGNENTPAGGHAAAEWDAATGVFKSNPDDNQLFGLSGAINFINKFGRNGIYSLNDPTGELHLEAIRYLQGKSPTPTAISGLSDSKNDSLYGGLPAYKEWTDPYKDRDPAADYACHKANVLVVGESSSQDSGNIPPKDLANDMPDIAAWKAVVTGFERQSNVSYPDAAGYPRMTSGNPHKNNALESAYIISKDFTGFISNTQNNYQIYGSAYWASTHDIRDLAWTATSTREKYWRGLRIKTLAFDVGGGLTRSSYEPFQDANTRDNNPIWLAAKYGGFEIDPNNIVGGPYNVWGNPFLQSTSGASTDPGVVTSELGSLQDYIWADKARPAQMIGNYTVASMPKTYYRAGESLLYLFSSFDAIFDQAVKSVGSIAGSAVASTSLTQASGTTIYRGSFSTSDWSGDLSAYPVTVNSSNVTTISTVATWSAAAQLKALTDDAVINSRNITVGQSDAGANAAAVEFKWQSISDTLKAALNRSSSIAVSDNLGQQRLNYIRGDSSNYGVFRTRTERMGDVINSGVVYSGAPSSGVSSAQSYSTFYNANINRTPMVAVGANDGMFHAFNANDGKELFAYIPSWVAPNLSSLTDLEYVDSHRSYVDGTPAVAEAELTSGWATVLVSGTGAGGKGVFALNVTDPSTFNASKVLWEFTTADDPDFDLGNVVGKPQILKLRTSASGADTATYKWFAVFGNGVNSYVADVNGRFSSTGKPALYFLDLSKPAGDAWVAGANFFKVSFPTNTDLNRTTAAGMVNFTAVLDAGKAVSKIYAGDLQGNVWKLNFANYGASEWSLANLSSFKSTSATGGTPIPMYIAKDAAGNVQPISVAPTISAGDTETSNYVMFGTGKYLESADKLSKAVQSEYMLYDDGTGDTDGAGGASAITSRAYLQAGVVDAVTGIVTVDSYTPGLAKSTESTVKSGWYFDFSKAGERQVNSGSLHGSKLVFASLIPTANLLASTCTDTSGGQQYSVDVVTGNGTSSVSTVGILGELLLLDMTGATVYTASDSTGRKTKTILTKVIQQGSAGLTDSTLGGSANDPNCPPNTPAGIICTRVAAGRLSWRQVNNYHQLKAADW